MNNWYIEKAKSDAAFWDMISKSAKNQEARIYAEECRDFRLRRIGVTPPPTKEE